MAGGVGDGADRDLVTVELAQGRALRFARGAPTALAHLHLGIYSFTRAALARFAALPRSAGERACDLEQLRALEGGMAIGVALLGARCYRAVNRPADVARVEELLARRGGESLKAEEGYLG